jgi:RHS repeat-associated protein
MPRGANTQTRTFNYIDPATNQPGAFLRSATNPENGTVSYTYNSNGTLASKTDAKNQQLTYQYDNYNRLTSVTWANGGPQVLRTYIYDTNSLDGSFTTYGAGRLVAVQNAQFLSAGGSGPSVQFIEMLSYSQAGQPIKKRLQVNENTKIANLDATYTYDNEGKMTSVNYPATYFGAGPTYTYSFDSMHRPVALTDQTSFQAVSNAQYNASNQLTSMSYYFFSETRQYNSLNQLTNLNGITYNYPTGANNGKISSQVVSGETISYQYDSLNRLASAAGSGWAENYGYDGFGNLVSKTPTAGSPPTLSIAVDPATNRIIGQFYDANGNQQSLTYTYDVENRIVGAAGVQYAYDSQNKRIWKGTIDINGNLSAQEAYFYGVDGQKLGTYALNLSTNLTCTPSNLAVYFGAKRVGTIDGTGGSSAFVTDRLGSHGSYYPYGEEKTTPLPNDEVKFATYTRDSATGLDYADQRYYSSQFGRFLSPDPHDGSAVPKDPGGWNRYDYVGNDPVNFGDPSGLYRCKPEDLCAGRNFFAFFRSQRHKSKSVSVSGSCGRFARPRSEAQVDRS